MKDKTKEKIARYMRPDEIANSLEVWLIFKEDPNWWYLERIVRKTTKSMWERKEKCMKLKNGI